MKQHVIWLLAPLLIVSAACGQDAEETLKGLQKEFDQAIKEYRDKLSKAQKAVREAKTNEERADAQKNYQQVVQSNPAPKFNGRFLELAVQNPKSPAAFDALLMTVRATSPNDKTGTWTKAMTQLQREHAVNPKIVELVRQFARLDDPASEALLVAVMNQHPEKKTQALACRSLASRCKNSLDLVERMRGNEQLKANVEKFRGKEFVAKLLDGEEALKKEQQRLQDVLEKKYADVLPVIAVGKPAPELELQDLKGKKVKLSDLKGKVVVLDVWATWCGPCKNMIPHSREIVTRHKDKPFAMVSISADQTTALVEKFVAEMPMPWTHWFNGPSGGIIEEWSIEGFPTVFIIDAKGVLRHKIVGFGPGSDKKLDDAIDPLVKEAEAK